MVAAGDHRGEKVFITNGTRQIKQIQHGERIAHGLLVRAPEVEFLAHEASGIRTADPEVDKPDEI